jgi:Flp pilus assembly protein TadG
MKNSRRWRCRGGSVLEMAFFLPWLIFLFVGAFDWGYYAHALISTENAARIAGNYASWDSAQATDTPNVCLFAVEELRIAPNIAASGQACGSGQPVNVSAALLTSSSTPPSPDGQPAATVSVTYTTTQLIPIPGLLRSQTTLYRTVTMRLRN